MAESASKGVRHNIEGDGIPQKVDEHIERYWFQDEFSRERVAERTSKAGLQVIVESCGDVRLKQFGFWLQR